MDYVSNNVGVIPALPDIRDILSKDFCENIMNVLVDIPFEIFDDSVCVQRDVSRVPLKLDAITPEEEIFLLESNDGLRHFECFDIHGDNVQSREGLLKVLRKLQVKNVLYFSLIRFRSMMVLVFGIMFGG